MNHNFKDMTGKKINNLQVIKYAGKNDKGQVLWECKCDCGNPNSIIVQGRYLRANQVRSCGCLKNKHGLHKSRINNEYRHMKDRCLNSKSQIYENYGGRGISICDEWLGENGFINFYNWAIKNGYSDKLTLDRINNDGNYEPDNCRWTTKTVQSINRRTNKNNASGIKGVYWSKKDKSWYAQITLNKKCIHLGYCKSKEEAVEKRRKAENKYFKPLLENILISS